MTIKNDAHGLPVQASRPAVTQNVAIGAGSVQSTAFQQGPIMNTYNPDGTVVAQQNNTTHIRMVATSNCWVAFGTNPTATTSGMYIPAGSPEYFWVVRGEKVAVIQDSVSGTLNIAELAQ